MYGQKQDIYTCRKIWSSGADPAVFYCGGTDDPASFGHHPRTLADHKSMGAALAAALIPEKAQPPKVFFQLVGVFAGAALRLEVR